MHDYFPKQKYSACLSKRKAVLLTRSTIMYIIEDTHKASKIHSDYFLKEHQLDNLSTIIFLSRNTRHVLVKETQFCLQEIRLCILLKTHLRFQKYIAIIFSKRI